MRKRTLILATVLGWSATMVAAQEADRVVATKAMVDAASKLLAMVAGGPGGTEAILGFDKGKNLALALDDEARQDWAYWPKVQDNGNHVHPVWRNKDEDFGMRLLGEHYRTSHLRTE